MADSNAARPAGSSNPNFGAPEVIETDDRRVACDGDGGALGHPRVFLEMGDETQVPCPYCGRLFVLKGQRPKPVTG